jgi:hypothetical protein
VLLPDRRKGGIVAPRSQKTDADRGFVRLSKGISVMSINQSKNKTPDGVITQFTLFRQLFDANLIGVFVSDLAGIFLDAEEKG